MRQILYLFGALFLMIPQQGFGKLRQKNLKSGISGFSAGRSSHIGTIRKITGGKITVQLRPALHAVRKKKGVQTASQQQGFRAVNPLMTADIISPDGQRKKVQVRFLRARADKTAIFEFFEGQAAKQRNPDFDGWRFGLENISDQLSSNMRDGSFGLGVFYELKWK